MPFYVPCYLARTDVPHAYGAVLACRHETTSAARKGQARDRLRMPLEWLDRSCILEHSHLDFLDSSGELTFPWSCPNCCLVHCIGLSSRVRTNLQGCLLLACGNDNCLSFHTVGWVLQCQLYRSRIAL